MAATPQRRSQRETAKVSTKKKSNKNDGVKEGAAAKTAAKASAAATLSNNNSNINKKSAQELITEEHLPPMSLVMTVMLCSGFMLMFAMRDFMSTGRNILGSADEEMMLWTKSTDWFHDGKDGWKSKAGGFSAVLPATTDANNMGGFFVRKMAGAAATTLCLHKLVPLLVHPTGAVWKQGHFTPLFYTAIVANVSVMIFFAVYWQEFYFASVSTLPMMQMTALTIETLVILYHLIALSSSSSSTTTTTKSTKDVPAVALNMQGNSKSPNSPPSRIVARTVAIVSSGIVLIAGRDLLLPGRIIPFLPRDDLYLEWTNAFLHSPPAGSPESMQHGMESPLYIGDLYISQYMALQLLLCCLYKFVTAFGFIRHGSNGHGQVQARMIWQTSTIGNCMILFLLRLFSSAASSASLDLRWHLMAFGYETFILGLYGFF